MKKLIVAAVVMTMSVSSFIANAQTQTSVGIKFNGTLTNVKLTDVKGAKNKFNAGAAVGGFAKIEFNENFALQPELMINYTESKQTINGSRERFKYAGVEIPVYAIGQFKAGSGKVFFGVGPHVGYGFSIDSKTEKLPEHSKGENKVELDHWYVGAGAIAGYEFNNGISLHAGYQMGFDVGSSNKRSGVKTQTASLGVGYKF